jgi:hypothetical protein
MNKHPLEEMWSTSAWDILTAIERGFRAQADVKGKLAELYLYRRLEKLQEIGTIHDLRWQDKDGKPDFLLSYKRIELRVECKNVRSPIKIKSAAAAKVIPTAARVELQKTRNSKDGEQTRGYKTDEFDVLGACLFNSTGKWEHLFVATRHLLIRPEPLERFLQVFQPVPFVKEGFWREDPLAAFNDAVQVAE